MCFMNSMITEKEWAEILPGQKIWREMSLKIFHFSPLHTFRGWLCWIFVLLQTRVCKIKCFYRQKLRTNCHYPQRLLQVCWQKIDIAMLNSGNLGHVRNNGNILWEMRYFIPLQCFVLLYNFGQQQIQHKMEIVSTRIR